ncbi:MAG: SusD/RagB family nutrient-binding outer membrane lipoprotein [Tenacibaculum sp.]
MKNIFITLFAFLAISSCQTDAAYDNLNKNPKRPPKVPASFLFTSATKSLFDQMTSTSVNHNIFRLLGQYWTETTYTSETNYDFNNRNITQYHWSELNRDVLLDLKSAREFVIGDPLLSETEKNSQTAQIDILMVYTWQQLVDSFGDIPYTEALDPKNALPAYDDAATIYTDLISVLNTAIANIGSGGFTDADKIYEGDKASWEKFANSLKLRIAMRLADVNPTVASTLATEAVTAGVFSANSDNATLNYETAPPNTNPLWVDLVQSGRSDFVPANTLVDIMNSLNDPRRFEYFQQNLGEGVFLGGIYGDNNTFSNYTHIAEALLEPDYPASLLDYAEVEFYLAQAAEMSIVGTPADAETHYDNAIRASFDFWGASDIDVYLANPNVAYATASGDWREKIGTQFWLAMYNRGFEGWTVWRTFDKPDFKLPVVTENPVPTRYTYPINEQNQNRQNYNDASAAIGGDEQTTKLFWDIN